MGITIEELIARLEEFPLESQVAFYSKDLELVFGFEDVIEGGISSTIIKIG